MSRRTYPNPPIIEAVVEFKFPAAPPKAVEQALRERLGSTYSAADAQDMVEAQFAVNAESVMTSTRRTHHRTVLRSPVGTRMLTCADSALGVHVLNPYPGWENFLDQIAESVEVLPEVIHKGPLESIGIRYINQIELPQSDLLVYEDFLNIIPPRAGESMPEGLLNHQSATRAIEHSTQTMVDLRTTLTSGPPAIAWLDILVHRKLDCPFAQWREVLDALRARERQIFEDCITDQARELFQ